MTNSLRKILSKNGISDIKADNLQWKTSESNSSSILFYKFSLKTDEEVEKFKERIKSIEFSLCIVNIDLKMAKCLSLNDLEFVALQEELIDTFYPFDFSSIYTIGVTGTNGKTTTVDLVRQICIQESVNILTIGTLGVLLNSKKVDDFSLTTPNQLDLRKMIYRLKGKFNVLALEVSSHALQQNRLGNLKLDAAGWTNISQDHLDYHNTMDDYFLAKLKIVNMLNFEDLLVTTSSEVHSRIEKSKIAKRDKFPSNIFFKASYNKENYSLAYDLLASRIPLKESYELSPVDGRFKVIEYLENYIVIDFAHTPDALKNIASEVKKSFPNHKLVIVFGCGGDRDITKRPLMGKVAISESDNVIITSDNPRFEDSQKIINDIIQPLVKNTFIVIEDRKLAIESALNLAGKNIILIAGKGDEGYVEVKGIKISYSDEEVVLDWINNASNK